MADSRPLDELLKLDSYQEMSDEEIETVIQWREKQAAMLQKTRFDFLDLQIEAQARYSQYQAEAAAAREILEKLAAKALGGEE